MVYEDEAVLAFRDIHPKAPVHLLVVPKQHIASVNELQEKDTALISRLIWIAKQLAEQHNISETGYRLSINVGRGGGQVVDHLHLHLLGGWPVCAGCRENAHV